MIQFLAMKQNGKYEVMFLNNKKQIITFYMEAYGSVLEPDAYPMKFSIL